jgi:hypothetical protein
MDPILRKADPILIEGLEIQTYVDINQNVCYYHGISVARFLNMSNIRKSTINKLYRQFTAYLFHDWFEILARLTPTGREIKYFFHFVNKYVNLMLPNVVVTV